MNLHQLELFDRLELLCAGRAGLAMLSRLAVAKELRRGTRAKGRLTEFGTLIR